MLLLSFFLSLFYLCHGVQGMSFTYASSVQLGRSVTVTWQRQSSEPTQFTLKLIAQDGQTDSSHDLTVPDGQLSGTEIFLPSVVGQSKIEGFSSGGSSLGTGNVVEVLNADGSTPPPPTTATVTHAQTTTAATAQLQPSPTHSIPTTNQVSSTGSDKPTSEATTETGATAGVADSGLTTQSQGIVSSSTKGANNSSLATATHSITTLSTTPNTTSGDLPQATTETTSPTSVSTTSRRHNSAGLIAGVVTATIVFLLLLSLAFCLWKRQGGRNLANSPSTVHPFQPAVSETTVAAYADRPGVGPVLVLPASAFDAEHSSSSSLNTTTFVSATLLSKSEKVGLASLTGAGWPEAEEAHSQRQEESRQNLSRLPALPPEGRRLSGSTYHTDELQTPMSEALVGANNNGPQGLPRPTSISSHLTERQVELRERAESAREGISALQAILETENVPMHQLSDARAELLRLRSAMEWFLSLEQSDWARGMVDEPPPAYNTLR